MPPESALFLTFPDVGVLFLLRDGTTDTITGKEGEGDALRYLGARGPWDRSGSRGNGEDPADLISRIQIPAWRVIVLRWKEGQNVAREEDTLFFRDHVNALRFTAELNANTDPDENGDCRGAHPPSLIPIAHRQGLIYEEDKEEERA